MKRGQNREQRQHFIALPPWMHFIAAEINDPIEDWCIVGSSAQRDNKEHHLIQTLEQHFSSERSKQGRRKLQRHHADVDGHTDRRLKQYRVHVEVTPECRSTAGSSNDRRR